MVSTAPPREGDRVELLDVLRGFAIFGIAVAACAAGLSTRMRLPVPTAHYSILT
jgi:uncharacterized membrane protein YeiB